MYVLKQIEPFGWCGKKVAEYAQRGCLHYETHKLSNFVSPLAHTTTDYADLVQRIDAF